MSTRVAKLGDLTKPMVAMLGDVERAEAELDAHSSDSFYRRNFIRAQFAAVEGAVYLLKQTVLGAALRSKVPLEISEYAILSEETFDLDSSGNARSQPKFLKLADNLRFAVRMINKVFKGSIDLKVGSKHWSQFKQAIEIRNRIVHPKGIAEFEVSDDEIRLCREMADEWLHQIMSELIKTIHAAISKRA